MNTINDLQSTPDIHDDMLKALSFDSEKKMMEVLERAYPSSQNLAEALSPDLANMAKRLRLRNIQVTDLFPEAVII